ncbi:DNA cytosine methyltransferase [Allorhizobium terrae]|uniref:DNA (cytosine-5-)-methyltransferase n=1 Tax=Allorhizobium terrae TaxID=1848972 RepID=A0A4S3ZZ15_9HYPH|nr:DNA cytosine methyltransferase [Allorhizobium terrae]THF50886.1 DNA cytosine methyltransferase [Allorhizobium terrae]
MLEKTVKAETPSERFARQSDLVARSVREGVELYDLLYEQGLDLDDLIYSNAGAIRWDGSKPPRLDSFSQKCCVPVVSFFTGCGGMDLGFETLGFEHVAAFEFNEIFCKTLRKNRPEWKIFGPPYHSGDVSKFDEVVEALSPLIKKPFEGVFVGGPPCQPFSIAANQRFSRDGENFKRTGFNHEKNGNLLFDYVNLIIEFLPSAFVIENVPGLRDLDGGEQLSIAIGMLQRAGYTVADPEVLDAANHGVPQFRQRMFVVGSRLPGKFVYPERKAHFGAASVLADLPTSIALNHETRKHRAESIQRYMILNYGERDQLGRVDRLTPNRPSKTVIAGGTNGGGRSHLHPEIPRTLSVRECARLQTFPDDYQFVGPTARQFTQVGNAVPPVLAAVVGQQLIKAYF